ncbi:cytochrome (ubi)quinol oxidase subunit III [Bradyrhizobium sp. 83012]|uniref:Cytochrome (Ubi)quinol oxidase subunit III n=1 Tax=Bradyrhizobium aeschynomenes TaxID=2734909 RepID=A0ABX2CHH5_9BRAD|nr:cytochrome (ubi)quinol oxidase subunit III [Bradyrhizobium aeschynomenes]NPU66772.1 cytochrome (ubi)quinol oxidase subunit III [Bradyrhizobium aeschynomenes]NPV24749.1 cytochrome (ubi)quinol oxidase subunit III [Bradyrhizobium aeschynomenes]
MSVTSVERAPAFADPHHLRAAEHDGPAPKRIVTGFGFWIFLLSDIVMFSCFFASFAVLSGATAGGPGGAELFDIGNVALETGLLLLSSFTCGMASIAADRHNRLWFQVAMAVTGLFGAGFLLLEVREFAELVGRGDGPSRSAFLSAFFTLVGCHGLHVAAGILWLLTMMAQVVAKGFRADIERRILCFALFWHALDIIWVAVFSVVYLLGSAT